MRWAFFLVWLCAASVARAGPLELPDGFVRLSDAAPAIAQDIRYARSFNFTGAKVPGYEAGACILTEVTARAVMRVEARLNADGFGLLVFDCYRPTGAVAHFRAWAKAPAPSQAADRGAVFYPGLSRRDLFAQGFIAARSSHSLGVTIDAGLRRLDDPVLRPDFGAGSCDGRFDQRAAESTLDMGTNFDCFSPLSALGAAVTAKAQANRARLRAAMLAEGFAGYDVEWWHFRNAADPAATPQSFAVR